MLVNNASAISLTGTLQTPMKRFDLMMGVNVRGTFAASQACIPHLVKSKNPHILTLWPRTTIATAAIEMNFPPAILQASRKPAIMADAAYAISNRDSRAHTLEISTSMRQYCARRVSPIFHPAR